jgi:hypothetical protein
MMLHMDQFGPRVASIRFFVCLIYICLNTSPVYLLVPFFRLCRNFYEETKLGNTPSSQNTRCFRSLLMEIKRTTYTIFFATREYSPFRLQTIKLLVSDPEYNLRTRKKIKNNYPQHPKPTN